MTDAPRAQSQQSDVEWLRNLPHVVTSTGQRVVTTATLEKCRAIADALEEALAEYKWISAIRKEGPLRRIDELEQQLATCRAENAALKARDKAWESMVDDLFKGFFERATDAELDAWIARAQALRAGQQKG